MQIRSTQWFENEKLSEKFQHHAAISFRHISLTALGVQEKHNTSQLYPICYVSSAVALILELVSPFSPLLGNTLKPYCDLFTGSLIGQQKCLKCQK